MVFDSVSIRRKKRPPPPPLPFIARGRLRSVHLSSPLLHFTCASNLASFSLPHCIASSSKSWCLEIMAICSITLFAWQRRRKNKIHNPAHQRSRWSRWGRLCCIRLVKDYSLLQMRMFRRQKRMDEVWRGSILLHSISLKILKVKQALSSCQHQKGKVVPLANVAHA